MNEIKEENLIYYGYARKSSSDKSERQVKSNPEQKNFINKKHKELKDQNPKVKLKHIFEESKSAKDPDIRIDFYEMLKGIEAGKANGLICYRLDRLSRNALDTARIQTMLRKGIIKSIVTSEREYKPRDSGLIFYVFTGLADEEILVMSDRVKQRLQGKVDAGDKPGFAFNGFLNTLTETPGKNYIIPDPERFDLIKKMFEMFLTSKYSIGQIVDIANNDWGFRTRIAKKVGGKLLSKSTLRSWLLNPFFAGYFMHKGEMKKGNHKNMISLMEHYRILEMLGKNRKSRITKRHIPFTSGIIHCAECQSAVSAQIKKERYVYYHCIAKNGLKCSQRDRKWIKAENLDTQIKRLIDTITIFPEFRDWALAKLREMHKMEEQDQENIFDTQQKTLASCNKQLNNLLDLKLQDRVDEKEYDTKRNLLLAQKHDLEEKLKNTQQRVEDWLKDAERIIDFATYAHANYLKADYQTKNKILIGLGQIENMEKSQNFLLDKGILRINPNPVLETIKKNYPEQRENYIKLELHKTPPEARTKAQIEGAAQIRAAWDPGQFQNLCI